MSMSVLPQVPDCSSVSQLPPLFPADGKDVFQLSTLFLVSQPVESKDVSEKAETDTGYISRYVTTEQLETHFKNVLSIEQIKSDIEKKLDKDALSTYATLCVDNDQPYILSSFTVSAGVVTSVGGYVLSTGLETAIDTNGYIPNRLSTCICYDETRNMIQVRNFDGSISSEISRDDILSDLTIDRTLSNVTVNKDGTRLYLHFVIQKTAGVEELRKVTINLSSMAPLYEFTDGIKLIRPEAEGKLSVVADYAVISAGYVTRSEYNALSTRIQALEDRFSSKSFVSYETTMYEPEPEL